jgi:pimeloyl-ACP methyl ester carboxylesterase/outer membrane protein assembly factor BamB
MIKGIVRLAVALLAFGLGTSTSIAAPGALWTTPLSSAGSFVYGSPTGGFLLDLWDGTSLDPAIGTSAGGQVAVGDHDAGVAPVFDSAGDVYRWGLTPTGLTEEMGLEKDSPSGQVLWRTPVDAEQSHDVVLGGNHDLYASYFSNADGWHLLRLDANTGQVIWNDAGPAGIPEPTATGAALVSAGQVQLVGSDESSGGTVTYAAGSTPELYSVAHNDQGDILALNLPQWVSGGCGYTTGPATVTELDPSGRQLWTREVPMSGCIHPTVAALPNGSWALSDQESGEILGLSGIDGSTLWTASTEPRNYGPFILGADANGDIYAEQNLVTNCVPEPANTTNCQGEEILQINGATGSFSTVLSLVDTSSPNTMTLGLENMPPGRDTNTSASIAPGRLFTVEEDLVGDPGNFPNSLWSFNGYSLPAGAPYPTPPDETGDGSDGSGGTQPPTGNGGGDTTGGSDSGAGGSSSTPSSGVPIVIVPGLGAPTEAVKASDPSCQAAGLQFAPLCTQLRNLGHPVYVVAARPGGGSGAVLNSDGDLNTNAVALRSFLEDTLHEPALLVGHSMGGLVARIAISQYGVPTAGLFTIGTPHDGSFLADIAAGIDVGCATDNAAMCAFLGILAKSFPALNSPAALEMTRIARIAESLSVPSVPVWTVAGTEIGETAPPGYLVPNDLVVGETSAHGLSANLGKQEGEFNLPLYHLDPFKMGFLGVKLGQLLPVADIETESVTVVGLISTAANELTDGLRAPKAVQTDAVANRQAVTATARRRSRATTYSVKMFTAHAISTTQHLTTGDLAVADQSFQASCGKAALATIVLPGGLFAFDAADTTCTHPTVTPPRHGSLTVTSDPGAVYASVTIRGDHVTIILRAAQPVNTATLRIGKGTVRLQRSSPDRWHLTVRETSHLPAMLTMRCDGQTHAASLPL